MTDLLLSSAFTLWNVDTTWLELIAVVLAFAMVFFNILELHWSWPLAIISSILYFFLFWQQRLYGDACLQIVFAVLAVWGWWVWLRGVEGAAIPITTSSKRQRLIYTVVGAALWLVTGGFLLNFTDTDVPWWDAFPTAFSLVAQYLLAYKDIDNWLVWVVVNVVSVGLFAWKGLWLTSLLYLVFIWLSVLGWRSWRERLQTAAS
jgi:nicotinamide mononucleotide transporter